MELKFSETDLATIAEQIAELITARMTGAELIDGVLAYPEAEAARLLSLNRHQLRDERIDGRIKASTTRGGKIRYLKSDLLEYLERNRWRRKGAGE